MFNLKINIMKKIFLVILGISLFGVISNCQNLIRVNNNPGIDADYTNLQDANDNASDGDTIYVEGSETEYSGADISHSLTIIGPGYFLNENPKTQANGLEAKFNGNINFNTGSAGSCIIGCNLGFHGYIFINVNDVKVIRCFVNGIYPSHNGTINNIVILQNYIAKEIKAASSLATITNSIISNNIINGFVHFSSTSGPLQIANNVFSADPNYSIDCYNSTIQNNIICNKRADAILLNSGNTINNNILAYDGTNANGNQYNTDMSNVFTAYNDFSTGISTDGRWQLKAGSPAIGAGTGNVDCGVFGGVSPYVLSGLPDLPHIYEAIIPATANSGDGLSVTIKVKSGQ
jgi:hypothetical protein